MAMNGSIEQTPLAPRAPPAVKGIVYGTIISLGLWIGIFCLLRVLI